jgi:competence protein ComEC
MAAPGIGGGRLLALPLAWLAGVALQLQERALLAEGAYAAIAAAALLALVLAWLLRPAFAVAIVVAGALAAGFAVSGWQASLRLADTLPSALEGNDLVVTGVVASLPEDGCCERDTARRYWHHRLDDGVSR